MKRSSKDKKSKTARQCCGSCPSDWHPLRLVDQQATFDIKLDARPDVADMRDRMYVSTLVEVPTEIPLADYRALNVPMLNQGHEGACTGYALATVAHYLLRSRRHVPDNTVVSARMFYELAKRYDTVPGEDYAGSTARAAIKAWYKHGVCPESLWPSDNHLVDRDLSLERAQAARKYPLGAYFRIDSQDIVAMHAALAEVGVLFVTCAVHEGWRHVGADGVVVQQDEIIGVHAFAIVGFDADGFWVQNSWGSTWGLAGFGHISYDDWLENGSDVWVVRLGAELHLHGAPNYDLERATSMRGAQLSIIDQYCSMRPHIISLGENGVLSSRGHFANDQSTIVDIFQKYIPAITKDWPHKRIAFYAHGGLVTEARAIDRLRRWQQILLDNQIYPIFFVWNTDLVSIFQEIIKSALSLPNLNGDQLSASSVVSEARDDMLEPFVRFLGQPIWDRIKQDAMAATCTAPGGARLAAQLASQLAQQDAGYEFHFAAHSAGAIFLAYFMQQLCYSGIIRSGPLTNRIGFNLPAQSLTLWAPACTIDLFQSTFLPMIDLGQIKKFSLFLLDDASEQSDNCLGLYGKSLLYLVANSMEATPHIPWINPNGTDLLGMQKAVMRDPELKGRFEARPNEFNLVITPNSHAPGSGRGSQSRRHGDFDRDRNTLLSTLSIILGTED